MAISPPNMQGHVEFFGSVNGVFIIPMSWPHSTDLFRESSPSVLILDVRLHCAGSGHPLSPMRRIHSSSAVHRLVMRRAQPPSASCGEGLTEVLEPKTTAAALLDAGQLMYFVDGAGQGYRGQQLLALDAQKSLPSEFGHRQDGSYNLVSLRGSLQPCLVVLMILEWFPTLPAYS